MKQLLITTILMLPLVLLGCTGSHVTQTSQEVSNNPSSNRDTISATLPEPSSVIIYKQGKSQTIKSTDTKYNALVKEIDKLVTDSNLSKADVYKLFLINGDISKYRSQTGVELIYSTPFNLTIRSVNKSISRLFIYCYEAPMLFHGKDGINSYESAPLAIGNTDNLKKLIETY